MEADLVVLTGDIVDGSIQSLRAEVAVLSKLLPRGKIFYVPGNHEYYWGGNAWIEEMERMGARPLLNSSTQFEHRGARVLIGGVLDPAANPRGPILALDLDR